MKLSDIKNGNLSAEWAEKGYELPKFDIEAVKAKTHAEPTWVHFGAGNIFRAFPAAVLNDALNSGKYDRGVIVAESFDYEIIDKAYQPYDNLSLLVCLKSTGDIEKKVIASVTESLKADYSFGEDWARLVEIFQNPSLQMISFTITEKGYGVAPADLERGLTPVLAMGKVTALLYERFKAGKLPLTVQSMDNCSHNGDKVKSAVHAYASKWVEQGLVPAEFLAYVQDETKITFPWSMIDKITPRPDAKVQDMLAKDGFEDNYTIVTEKHTFTAPFVNAEETQYLCIEDHYTNGRPPLELGGVLYCDRETVDKIEKMKVCTCLNPLHTAMSIYGCMLDYTLISAEMADEDLRSFIQKIGYIEAMPVVVDPGVLNPYEFIGAVINRRLPNPFMPDAPQRIATDTSQKLAIRFGETIKAYQARGLDKSNLVLIPLVLAGYARYLKGIDDNGKAFEISPDPMLAELQAIVAPLEVKEGEQDFSCLKNLYSRADIFGVNLYEVGLGEQIEGMVKDTGVCLVLGPASSGKSTMAMQMLHSLTTGQNFLAQPAQKVAGDFGVLSYDMDYRMFGSILGAYPGIDAKRVSMVQAYNMGNPLNVPDFRRELASRWRKRGVEVVVVDSFSASFAGHNQNDAAEAMAHYRDLKTFALTEVGARVLVVIVHSTDNNPHRARGSTVHHDIADSIVGVSIEPKSGQRQLKMVKYRAAPGQNAAPTVITTAPDAVTHLVSLDSGAMTLAGIPLPPSVIAATAFPDTAEDASPGGVADPLAEGEEAKADPPEDYADWFPDLPDEEDREEVGTADEG